MLWRNSLGHINYNLQIQNEDDPDGKFKDFIENLLLKVSALKAELDKAQSFNVDSIFTEQEPHRGNLFFFYDLDLFFLFFFKY